MSRPRKHPQEMALGRVVPINPDSVYRMDEVPTLLRVGERAINAAIESGALRYVQSGNRYLFRGQWLLDYLEGVRASPASAD